MAVHLCSAQPPIRSAALLAVLAGDLQCIYQSLLLHLHRSWSFFHAPKLALTPAQEEGRYTLPDFNRSSTERTHCLVWASLVTLRRLIPKLLVCCLLPLSPSLANPISQNNHLQIIYSTTNVAHLTFPSPDMHQLLMILRKFFL